jgi:hypothetical protein
MVLDAPPRHAVGDEQGPGGFGRDTSRTLEAGLWKVLPRRLRVPPPDQKQVDEPDGTDDVRSDGVARPGGGETEVSADFGHETSRQVRAGPGSGLRRPVRVPAPDQEQGGRADHHDDAGTDSVGRPSRGEAEGGHKTTCEARFRVGRCFWARRRNRPGRRLLLPSRSNV